MSGVSADRLRDPVPPVPLCAAAPPSRIAFIVGYGPGSKSRSRYSIVGTKLAIDTAPDRIASATRSSSNLLWRITVPPAAAERHSTERPPMWKTGRASSQRSPRSLPSRWLRCARRRGHILPRQPHRAWVAAGAGGEHDRVRLIVHPQLQPISHPRSGACQYRRTAFNQPAAPLPPPTPPQLSYQSAVDPRTPR